MVFGVFIINIYRMAKIIRLTEKGLTRLVRKINEDIGDYSPKVNRKKNSYELYQMDKRKLEEAINLLEEAAKKGEDLSHFHMVIRMVLRNMDGYVEDLAK